MCLVYTLWTGALPRSVFREAVFLVVCAITAILRSNHIQVCAYNRTVSKVDDFLANEAKGTKVVGAHSIKEMCGKLKRPRRIMLLVKAGQAVDDFIKQIVSDNQTCFLEFLR